MSLAAGRLRHRVRIERRIDTQDSNLDPVFTWEWVATIWAAVEPLSSREFFAAQAAQSQVVARITIRHRDGLNAQMRLLHRGKVYNPAGFLPDKDSGIEYITIPVTQGVNQGD
jgi:SPP1 family predicted phage head-tail adaptor